MPTVADAPQDSRTDERVNDHGSRRSLGWLAVLGWSALIVFTNRVGQSLLDSGHRLLVEAPPLIGRFQLGPDHGLGLLALAAPVVAYVLVRFGPPLAAELSWRMLLWSSALASAAWAVALAVMSGWSWLARPMQLPGQYLLDVGKVGSPFGFLSHFVARIDDYGVHVRSHPPGFELVLSFLDHIGLRGSGWAAALVIAGGSLAVPAVLMTVREVAGENIARRVAPFLVLAPTALYVATTADALFAGVAAWSVALVVIATGRAPVRADRAAIGGGLLFGVAIMFSYGLALISLIPCAVAIHRRTSRPIVIAGLGAIAVLGAARLAGFSWLAGLTATRREYAESVASTRPYWYFLVANLAALAIITGPATAAGLLRLRDRRLWIVVGAALAVVAVADLSGMSKGEVERIWLPFAVWILPAAAFAGADDGRSTRRWLSAQAAVAVAVQVGVRTHW